jgi:hypothetical protein
VGLQPEHQVPTGGQAPMANLLEPAAKMTTLLVIGCYALGYLIVTVNGEAYGFLETSLIKPRAIVVGAIFILLTLLPISITQNTFFKKDSESESSLEMLSRLLLGLVDYSAACFSAALIMLLIFTDDLHGAPLPRGRGSAFLVLIWVTTANGIIRFAAARSYRRKPLAWVVFSIACLAGLIVGTYSLRGQTLFRDLVWMFGVTMVVNPYLSDIRRGLKLRFKIPALAGFLLVTVSIYSHYLFPFIKATWGGGAPVSATIYLSKDYPIHSYQKVGASLLEASDSGFYVVFDGDKKATFIPKASVVAMEFPLSSNKLIGSN